MHKSHQSRLTTLTNQINQQHAEQVEALKEKYEDELETLRAAGSDDKAADDELRQKLAVRIKRKKGGVICIKIIGKKQKGNSKKEKIYILSLFLRIYVFYKRVGNGNQD